MTEQKKKEEKKLEPKKAAPASKATAKKESMRHSFFFGIAAVVAVVVLGGFIYINNQVGAGDESKLTLVGSKLLGKSVASVNGDRISYSDYIQDKSALRNFYAQQEGLDVPNFEDSDLATQAVARLIVNQVLDEVADELDVELTDEDIEQTQNELLSRYASEVEAEEELRRVYGWDLETYTERIVEPYVLENKLRQEFTYGTHEQGEGYEIGDERRASHILFASSEVEAGSELKDKAQSVLDRIKGGEDFGALAAEFGSDGTKDVGGDLGWFGRGRMVAPFEEAVWQLEKGQLSDDLVETQFGYHIVRLDDVRSVRDFDKFMDDKIRSFEIEIFIDGVQNPFEQPEGETGEQMEHSDS